jgi:hypothetical protein
VSAPPPRWCPGWWPQQLHLLSANAPYAALLNNQCTTKLPDAHMRCYSYSLWEKPSHRSSKAAAAGGSSQASASRRARSARAWRCWRRRWLLLLLRTSIYSRASIDRRGWIYSRSERILMNVTLKMLPLGQNSDLEEENFFREKKVLSEEKKPSES